MSAAHAPESLASRVERLSGGWTKPRLKEICEVNPPRAAVLAGATRALAEGSRVLEIIARVQLPDSGSAILEVNARLSRLVEHAESLAQLARIPDVVGNTMRAIEQVQNILKAADRIRGIENAVSSIQRLQKIGEASARLSELGELVSVFARAGEAMTAFVPMACVDERHGQIPAYESRPLEDIARGFTAFAEGDILFAKITPCMQNGKHAIARNVPGGVGLASTEFHVIRPGSEVLAEWVHYYLRQPWVLGEAERHFTGSAGQQRVPAEFIEELKIPLPPLSEQRRITAIVAKKMAAVEDARMATEAQVKAAKALPPALICGVFDSPEAGKWPQRPLGEVLRLRKEIVHPYEKPRGRATFVGLEHLESRTGKRIGSEEIEMSELVGRKPRFHRDDIVYGYLRPYLNKVWVAEFDGLCSVDQYVYSVDRRVADVHFVGWFMRSATYLNRAPITSSPGQLPRIRTEEVASVLCGFPSIEEQRRTVSCIEAEMATSDRINGSLKNQLAAINGLPAAFLRRAFSGELR